MTTQNPLFLVFSSTGTVGNQIARQLLESEARVRVAVRNTERAADLAALGAEVVEADLSDRQSLTAAFEGVDRVALVTPYVQQQLDMVRNAVAAAQAAEVELLVRMSAAGADPEAEGALPRSHGLAEQAVKESGRPYVLVRPTFFQDNFVNYSAGSIKAQGAWYGASAGQATAYVSTADIAEVIVRVLRAPELYAGQTLELTGPEAHTEAEIAQWISEVAGYDVGYVDLSPEQLRDGMVAQQVPEWMADDMVGLERVKAAGWASQVSPDVERVLGRPGHGLKTFIEASRAAFAR
ncbi:MAG: SDR family oxidoreductase [Bradymonadia bacterium]